MPKPKDDDAVVAGCFGLAFLMVILGNLIWWSFVGWMIYLLVEHFTK